GARVAVGGEGRLAGLGGRPFAGCWLRGDAESPSRLRARRPAGGKGIIGPRRPTLRQRRRGGDKAETQRGCDQRGAPCPCCCHRRASLAVLTLASMRAEAKPAVAKDRSLPPAMIVRSAVRQQQQPPRLSAATAGGRRRWPLFSLENVQGANRPRDRGRSWRR